MIAITTYDFVLGKIATEATPESLTFEDGSVLLFYHDQDCCESVDVDDVVGDIADLVGSPLLVAEEVSSDDAPAPPGEYVESCTWTFYRFATVKGTVTVKWLGESNGYYSESVDWTYTENGKITKASRSWELDK
jgi:hypothetical protein